ncbi:M23 family metallopeptidase [Acinetobacter faecalis]|uniref:M23 family metallopeptidase n=1 Tax=Acinetobacter faecalis TaxID=2665161 RepID=A0A6L6GG86_9GAMM|nr:peptidoglycan DD-metalloendopeptidase family protein [Acinetobacter faecalis]MDY6460369.1 M23 family metallopeptidase [Acinetobacter faecalis]MDY6462586.1 M23 family metallopeptidase [Acinetobacter faecalis]MDY6485269.1 M23 family metallopeptidase [Acinetobacter faecalis]MDY6490105.1 M23 family metallopeptidase [Acinetobacter faecalis]MDY6531434.1 M23 family metallopeptidase [Acinetobacter faecalis]
MLRFSSILSLIFAVIFLAACSTAPKKPSQPLNPATVQELKKMSLPSQLPVPVQGIKRNNLTDTWGASRSSGRIHEGVDIMAPRGTKVFSATEGLIADLRNNNLGGKVIWVLGPSGSWHYYAHLDSHKRGLRVGDYIKKGDLIGYVGNTGNARRTAPHLHYGIYLGGKGRGAVNPYPYLR